MGLTLGIDTSNYTTSTALYDDETGELLQQKRPLPVKEGTVGLRQSDAVFGHVKALGLLLEELLRGRGRPDAVAVSATPRDETGSYMPCFLAGEMAARAAASAAGAPLYATTHQAGHVAAALLGADQLSLLERPFLAFHVSGGTTECLYVTPDSGKIIAIRRIARSLDLHGGQVVDRVGAMLGLPFPAGPALEELAAQSARSYAPRPAMKDADCCLSGVENRCRHMLDNREPPEDIANYCMSYLREALTAMTQGVTTLHPGLPLVYAGGVMSNRMLQKALSDRFGGVFAPPAYSADNAAGVALLGSLLHRKGT